MSNVRICRLPEVERRVGLHKSAIYQRIAAGTFPRPVKLGPRASGWIESEIDSWLEARLDERAAA